MNDDELLLLLQWRDSTEDLCVFRPDEVLIKYDRSLSCSGAEKVNPGSCCLEGPALVLMRTLRCGGQFGDFQTDGERMDVFNPLNSVENRFWCRVWFKPLLFC